MCSGMLELRQAELAFFAGRWAALPDVRVEVKRTQISFKNRHLFAAASFTPVRRRAERPAAFLTVTFGLPYQETSPRIDVAVEVYPRRWTHHVTLGSADEVDPQLLGWICEAAAFAAGKR